MLEGYAKYTYDESHFAIEIVNYIEGNGVGRDYLNGTKFNIPENALARPTVDTTPDNWYINPADGNVPVNPVYPAFRASELVSIGQGGELIVKFDHKIADDINNPYGVDFIIFGNSMCVVGNGQGWTNRNPEYCRISGGGFCEGGIVSVSQDGENWLELTAGDNIADGFAPTLGRLYEPELLENEPNDGHNELGTWNKWWTSETNPTLPLDPEEDFTDWNGWSVAQLTNHYGYSAGGSGFDLKCFRNSPEWIQYIKVSNPASSGNTPEIDAFSDVSCCGDWQNPYPEGDYNMDCLVSMDDFAYLANRWLACQENTDPQLINCYDMNDLSDLAENWLVRSWGNN